MNTRIAGGVMLGLVVTVTTLSGQSPTLQSTGLRIGEAFTTTITGGVAGMPYVIAIDLDPGPTVHPVVGVTSLGFTSDFNVLPPAWLDAQGSGSYLGLLGNDPADAGRMFYLQALSGDPGAGVGWSHSNPLALGIHPGEGVVTQTTMLTLGDNEASLVPLPAPMTFSFYGQSYSELYVSSNGIISFESPWAGSLETIPHFLAGPPKIGVLWDDFSPQVQGNVVLEFGGDFVRVRWEHVPQALTYDDNTVAVTLFTSGIVSLEWPAVTTTDGLVGLSPGHQLAQGQPADLSTGIEGQVGAYEAPLQQFFAGLTPFDLHGQRVSFVPRGAGTSYRWFH